MKKLAICFGLLILSLSFIQGANFPAPALSCQPVWECPEGYDIVPPNHALVYGSGSHNQRVLNKEDNCGNKYRCLEKNSASSNSVPAQSIGNYLSAKVTVGSGEPTGESVVLEKSSDKLKEGLTGCSTTYSYGYVKDGKYCAEEYIVRFPNGQERYTLKNAFVEQKNIYEECVNNFECKTNYCSAGFCKNQTEENYLQLSAKVEEEVSKRVEKELNKKQEETIDKIESQLENLDENKTYSVKVEDVEIPVNKNIMKQVLNWFREILA